MMWQQVFPASQHLWNKWGGGQWAGMGVESERVALKTAREIVESQG